MKTAPILSFCAYKNVKKEKPYYLTRQKTPEEIAVAQEQGKRAKGLITKAVATGLGVSVVYMLIKGLIFKK